MRSPSKSNELRPLSAATLRSLFKAIEQAPSVRARERFDPVRLIFLNTMTHDRASGTKKSGLPRHLTVPYVGVEFADVHENAHLRDRPKVCLAKRWRSRRFASVSAGKMQFGLPTRMMVVASVMQSLKGRSPYSVPFVKPASRRDDDNKADPFSRAGLSHTPSRVPDTHTADTAPVLEGVTMVQADTDSTCDNVTRFPSATSEPQPRSKRRRRDRTGAARQAKFRSRNNGDRYVQPDEDVTPPPSADAPRIAPAVTQSDDDGVTPPARTLSVAPIPYVSPARHGRGITFATLTAALALATVSGGFSITGMTSIFVGAYWPVIGMGVSLEVGKLSAIAWLGHQRGSASRRLRAALATLVAVLMGLNAVGCYGFLAKAHIGHRVEGETSIGGRMAEIQGLITVQERIVAGLDRQIAQIDNAIPGRVRGRRDCPPRPPGPRADSDWRLRWSPALRAPLAPRAYCASRINRTD
jgi:hypothetical protein